MFPASQNRDIPLNLRMRMANASLAYADALVTGNSIEIQSAGIELRAACGDVRICQKALDLGMVQDCREG